MSGAIPERSGKTVPLSQARSVLSSGGIRLFADFLTWWKDQLLSLLPPALRRLAATAAPAVTVTLIHEGAGQAPSHKSAGQMLEVALHRGAGRQHFTLDPAGILALRRFVAAGNPAGSACAVLLPPDLLLEKDLRFPLAAARDPARVAAFEIDRETPFSAGEVLWSAALIGRDAVQGMLALRLSLVPRARIEPLLQSLAEAGLSPASLNAGDGSPRIHLAAGRTRGPDLPWVSLAAGLLCLLLTLTALVLPVARTRLEIAAIDRRIAALGPAADTAAALRQRIGGSIVGGSASGTDHTAGDAGTQAAAGDPLLILQALTAALPDDSYLTDFALHRRQISISGQSAQAAALIARLSDHPLLRDPGFAAPVTRDPATGRDSFTIHAGLSSQ